MFEETVSIDLGASYTKVCYRRTCVPKRKAVSEQEAKMLIVDNSSLIPSLAIRTKDKRQPWVFGWKAAKMNPATEMEVFQNWKADLFHPTNNKDSVTAFTVAGKFFEWLKIHLNASGIDLRKCHTRVALPAFKKFNEHAMLIARCMDLNGWEDPSLILKVTEPRANVIGLFSEGRNIVGRNSAAELLPNYGRMFGQQNVYIQAARGFVLHGSHDNLVTVMVVDIGAFTTDIASLTFDVADVTDGLSAIRQESHPLGVINDLDVPLFTKLAKTHSFSWADLSFNDCELLKRSLYNGTPYSLLARFGGKAIQVQLGTLKDFQLVNELAEKFASAVLEKIVAISDEKRPERIFLTGGGSLIKPVAAALKASLRQIQMRVQEVCQDSTAAGTDSWRSWKETGEGLQRLATALGSGSVILQESSRVSHDGQDFSQRQPPVVAAPPSGCVPCRCQGGNKDCCFCNGRGCYTG